jgi:CIC family chloride channel protein
MGTAFAGIIRTPLTSVIMIFEVTRDYTIIVPLMISNLIAFYISQRLQAEPLYEALAKQDGLHLPTGEFRHQARRLNVTTVIREAPEPLSPKMSVASAADRVSSMTLGSWPVSDDEGLVAMVRVSDLATWVDDGRGKEELGSLIDSLQSQADDEKDDDEVADNFVHVHGDQPLSQALSRMGETRHTVLPVVSRANARILLGIVTLDDVLRGYGVEKRSQIADGDPHDE